MTILGLRRTTVLLTLPLLLVLAAPARTQTLIWDPVAGDGRTGGPGPLDRAGDRFFVVLDTSATRSALVDGRTLAFRGTPGIVTIADGTRPRVEGLRFDVAGYLLQGDAILQSGSNPALIQLGGATQIASDLVGAFDVEALSGAPGIRTVALRGDDPGLSRLSIGAGVVVNANDVGGAVIVDAGGRISYRETVGSILSAGEAVSETGAFRVADNVDVTGGTAMLQGTVGGRVRATGGAVSVASGTALGVAGNVALDGAGASLAVSGALAAGTVTGVAGSVVAIAGPGALTADVTTSGDLTLQGAVGGAFAVTGDIAVNGGGTARLQADIDGDLTLGADVSVAQTGALLVTGTLTNRADVTTTDRLDAEAVANTGRLNVAGGILMVTGGDPLDNDGVLIVGTRVVGDVDNAGTATVAQGGTLQGALRNAGTGATATILGQVTQIVDNLADATLRIGAASDDGATVDGIVDNAGTLIFASDDGAANVVTGDIVNRATGQVSIRGRLRTDIANAGTVTVTGISATTLTGDVTGAGDLQVTGTRGRIDGIVTTGGTLAVAAATRLVVTGRATILAGGDLDLDGRLDADVTVAAAADAAIDGVLDGALTSRGRVALAGAVTGDVALGAGTATLAGTIGGALDVAGGAAVSDTGDLSVAGRIENAGRITTGGDVAAAGGLENAGTLTIGAGTTATVSGPAGNAAGGTLDVDGTLAGGAAGDLLNDGTLTLTGRVRGFATLRNGATGDLRVTAGGTVDADLLNDGAGAAATIAGGVGGGVTNANGATLAFDGASTVGGAVGNAARMDVTGTLVAAAGVTSAAAGDLRVSGRVTGDVATSGAFALTGRVAGAVDVATGTAALAGAVDGDLTLRADAMAAQTGALAVGGAFANDTTFATAADLTAGSARNGGVLTVTAGTILAVADGALANAGTLAVAGAVAGDVVSTAGRVDLDGTVAGDLAVSGGAATLGGTVGGDLLLSAGAAAMQDGALSVGGTLDVRTMLITTADIAAGRVRNAGDLTVSSGTAIAIAGGDGDLANSGTLAVGGTLRGDVRSTAGRVDVSGRIAGDLAASGGTVGFGGDVDGALTLSGDATLAQDGAVAVAGTFANDATFATAADFDAGRVVNTGDLAIIDGTALTITAPDGTFANAGTVGIAGMLRGDLVSTDGAVRLSGGVAGDVAISGGAAALAGSIDGALGVTGGAAATGGALVVGGAVAVGAAGRLDVGDRLQAVRVDNAGTLAVAGGTLASAGDVASGGTLRVAPDGRVEAARFVTAGTAEIAGTVAAPVVNGGALGLSGTIGGRFENAVGTASLRDGARITGPVANAAELIVAGGATAEAGVANAGLLRIAEAGVLGAVLANGSNGIADVDGTLRGTLDNRGEAFLSGVVDGPIANGGLLVVDGDAAAGVTTSNGQVRIEAGTRFAADLFVTGGTATILGTLVGDLTNDGAVDAADTRASDLTSEGAVGAAGPLESDRTNGGVVDVIGTVVGATVNRAVLRVLDGGLLDGSVENAEAGSILLDGGRIAGTLVNRAHARIDSRGASALTGTATNAGDLTVLDGRLTVDALTNDGRIDVLAGATLAGGRLTNRDTIALSGRIANAVVNGGIVAVGAGGSFGGALIQDGIVIAAGGLRLGAGGQLRSGSVTSLAQGADGGPVAYGAMDVTGALRVDAGAVLRFDIDVTEGTGGAAGGVSSDVLRVRGGALTGDLTLAFAPQGAPGQLDPLGILVVDADGAQPNAYGVDTVGLEPFGALVYRLEARGGDTFVTTAVNPGIGGLSGTISLTQSLIGQVVNRPSSPFVSALVAPEGGPCSTGLWSRAVGGYANADGDVTSATGTFSNDLEATYGGLQFGADFGCVDGGVAGFDVTYGGTAGYTGGSVAQDIFAFDLDTGAIDTGAVTGTIDNRFGQLYGGAYVAAARGGFVADLQYRLERTEFDLETSSAAAGGGIGVDDQSFRSDGQTLSGSLSYALPFGPDGAGWLFVPTTGFAVSRLSTDDVSFAGGGSLEFEDTTSKIGFVGATVARTRASNDEASAISCFGTATYYADVSDDLRSTFFDGTGGSESVSVENIGDYGEVSLGLNYVRILEPGRFGPARQLNASIRLDGRVSDRLDSVGLTAQVRLQF